MYETVREKRQRRRRFALSLLALCLITAGLVVAVCLLWPTPQADEPGSGQQAAMPESGRNTDPVAPIGSTALPKPESVRPGTTAAAAEATAPVFNKALHSHTRAASL